MIENNMRPAVFYTFFGIPYPFIDIVHFIYKQTIKRPR